MKCTRKENCKHYDQRTCTPVMQAYCKYEKAALFNLEPTEIKTQEPLERLYTIALEYMQRTDNRLADIIDALDTMPIESALAMVRGIITEHKQHTQAQRITISDCE